MKKVKESVENITDLISLSILSRKYFDKERSWFYHKLNEDIVNGQKYEFTDNEIETLICSLINITDEIQCSINNLKQIKSSSIKQKGKFFTENNPFVHPFFQEWMKEIPTSVFLEPFAGSNNIPMLMSEAGFTPKWKCYDIAPPRENNKPQYKVVKRNCLTNFPANYKVVITNPPYLAKSSATRQKLSYPHTQYDDLYKMCVDRMLNNSDYIAAIVPESFITSNLFHNRIYGIISLNIKISSKTNCPVCLALFYPDNLSGDFTIYIGDEKVGTYNELKKYDLSRYENESSWCFNVSNGSIGVKCVDNGIENSICFCLGDSITSSCIKQSSRAYTRISGLPVGANLEGFIDRCNQILNQYRDDTRDIFLTSFKGFRKDGKYRRRIDFSTIRQIMNKALAE